MCPGPKVKKIVDLSHVSRFMEPPLTGPFCDLLWSDPLLEHVLGYKLSDQEFAEVSGLGESFSITGSYTLAAVPYHSSFFLKITLCAQYHSRIL